MASPWMQIVLILLTVGCVLAMDSPVTILIEHRYGTSEFWKKRGTMLVSQNPETMKYRLESLEDDVDRTFHEEKKKLEVILLFPPQHE